MRSKKRRPAIGCGYIVAMAIATSLLMIANSFLVGKILEANWSNIPELFQDIRLFQACQLFIPIVLVMIEFWIFDRVRDAGRRTGQATPPVAEPGTGRSGQ